MIEAIPLICMIGGVLAMLGGVAFLFKQKVVVDAEGHVTEVEIPFFGKIRSNYPSVGIALIGAALSAYTLEQTSQTSPKVDFLAQVRSGEAQASPLPFHIGVVPQEYFRAGMFNSDGVGQIGFNVDAGKDYQVVILRPIEVTTNRVLYQSIYGPALYEDDKLHFTEELR